MSLFRKPQMESCFIHEASTAAADPGMFINSVALGRASGRRPSHPERLPRNRTCAFRIRLFGMTGYYPRHRPVHDLSVPSCNDSCAGALMAAQTNRN
jgi:hypothetical protein